MPLRQPPAAAGDRCPGPAQQQRPQRRVDAGQRASVQPQRSVCGRRFGGNGRPVGGGLFLHIVQRGRSRAGQTRQGIGNLRVQMLRQGRHYVEAHPVAGEIRHIVGAVIPVVYALRPAAGDGVGAPQRQQGPPQAGQRGNGNFAGGEGAVIDVATITIAIAAPVSGGVRVGPGADFPHPAQAVQPAAPGDVQQNRFRLVVGGMPHGHGTGAGAPGHPRQERIAQIPRRLLKGTDAAPPLVRRHIGFVNSAGQAVLRGQPAHEIGVIMSLLPPEIVNQVGDVEPEAGAPGDVAQDEQQGGGIGAAGYAGHNRIPRPQPEAPRRRPRFPVRLPVRAQIFPPAAHGPPAGLGCGVKGIWRHGLGRQGG